MRDTGESSDIQLGNDGDSLCITGLVADPALTAQGRHRPPRYGRKRYSVVEL
ncbi:MAG: hypothetical protein QOJ77_2440 [Microbacteriaceae bacterium]|jgi:hypothetical protein|nr:hypothetical protein [Microbacteriaceae bacterium]